MGEDHLQLRLDGFEGPLDLLLDLARAQKVDLHRISILALVDQFLLVLEGAGRVRLELAADWLVMAAWLAWLKSRLLLPDDEPNQAEAMEAADVLAARLLALQAVRAAAHWLGARPQLGQDIWARAIPEDLVAVDRSGLQADTRGLLRAYMVAVRRAQANRSYVPAPLPLWSVADALGRLESLMGRMPDWTVLEHFLPEPATDPLQQRAAVAATLIAGLELARDGQLRLRQDRSFGPILLAGAEAR